MNLASTKRFRVIGALGAAGALALGMAATAAAPAGAVTSPPYNTSVSVATSALTAVTGQSLTFTAKVASIGHGTPVGQVTFTLIGNDGSTPTCDGGSTTVSLSAGSAQCVFSAGLLATGGPYAVSVSYVDSIDSNYKPGSASRTQVVNQAKVAVSVTPSVNPAVTGQPLVYTAAVSAVAPGAGAPTGTVTFTGVTCDGGNTVTVAGGTAQCALSGGLPAAAAGYVVAANYSGDSLFLAGSSSVKQLVKVAAATVSVVPNPGTCTGSNCVVSQGVPLTFTASAAASGTDGGTGQPAGTIAFSITRPGSNSSLPCDGGTNTFSLTAGASVTCAIAAGLPASLYYKVTAVLSSSLYATASTSIFVNSALASTQTVTSIPRDLGAGESFAVTAVVTPTGGYAGSAVPGGFVNVLVCGNNSNGLNGCQGGAVPVSPTGIATYTVGGGEFPGSYSYAAIYVGDQNFYSSTARPKYVAISKSSTQTVLSEAGGFASFDGQAVAITATVIVPNGAAGSTLVGPPTGSVTFSITAPDGSTVSCADGNTLALPVDPGQAQATVTCFLPPGTLTDSTPPTTSYFVHAAYSGDSDYVISNGQTQQVVVAPLP